MDDNLTPSVKHAVPKIGPPVVFEAVESTKGRNCKLSDALV